MQLATDSDKAALASCCARGPREPAPLLHSFISQGDEALSRDGCLLLCRTFVEQSGAWLRVWIADLVCESKPGAETGVFFLSPPSQPPGIYRSEGVCARLWV
jgi:hypothetical protein